MEKIQKRIIPKSLFVVPLCLILLMPLMPIKEVNAQTPMINARIMFMYDEEMESGSFDVLGCFPAMPIPVSMENYIKFQFKRMNHRFNEKLNINFTVVGLTKWESTDSLTRLSDLLDEAFQTMLWINIDRSIHGGNWIWYNVLVAWTRQHTDDGLAGLAFTRCCILKPQGDWLDDNLLQHEVSHVLDAPDHSDDVDCVMCTHTHYVNYLHTENLEPCYDGMGLLQVTYLWIEGYIPKLYRKDSWCEDCKSVISLGVHYIVDPADFPPQEDPIAKVATFLIAVAILISIIVVIKLILKRRKKARKHEGEEE